MHLTLYYSILCPASRLVRMVLVEKQVSFTLVEENFYTPSHEYLMLNPIGLTPSLVVETSNNSSENYEETLWNFPLSAKEKRKQDVSSSRIVMGSLHSILEFLGEYYCEKELMPHDTFRRAYIRSLSDYFNIKFYHEISGHLIFQKIIIPHILRNIPSSSVIRNAHKALNDAMLYMERLLEDDGIYLAGDECTLVDYAAAAQFAILDYINAVSWSLYPRSKEWYSNMKSRRSVRTVLLDEIPYVPRPLHYLDPDF